MTREDSAGLKAEHKHYEKNNGQKHSSHDRDGLKHRSNGKNANKKEYKIAEVNGGRKRHDSGSSEVSLQSAEQYIPTPPDGGWGWVIVLCSMVCNLIVDGIGYTFGVFISEFEEVFQESKSKVALAGSLLCGVYLFAGPIVSAMTNKFGCRPVVIVGSCLATVAFVLATLSPNLNMLIITYGVIGGFGFGMMYLPAIVSVGYYFEKKRAFATGLAVCGSGVGTFILPPLIEFLLQVYNWQGALLIIAGIIFNGCVFGALMRPLEVVKKPKNSGDMEGGDGQKYERTRGISESSTTSPQQNNQIAAGVMAAKLSRERRLQDNESDLGSLPSIAFVKRESGGPGGIPIPGSEHRRYKTSIGSSYADSTITESMPGGSPLRDRDISVSPTSPLAESPQIVVGDAADPESEAKVSEPEVNDETSTEKSEYFTPPETNPNSPVKSNSQPNSPTEDESKETSDSGTYSDKNNFKEDSVTKYMTEVVPLLEVPAPHTHAPQTPVGAGGSRTNIAGGSRTNMNHLLTSGNALHISKKDLARPLYRKDIFYSGSVLNIQAYQSQPDMKSYITSITTIPGEMELVDSPSPSSRVINSLCGCLPRSARDTLSEMVDFSLLKDVSFMLICLGNFTAFLGFFIPFMYLPPLAVSLGISKTNAAFLISIIGITNTGGRVLVGKIADLKIVSSLVITWVSIFVCAAVTAIIPLCTSFALLATAAALFGLGVASYISLSSVIICDRLGLEKLTNAFGLMCLVRGIAGMIGSPFAGYLYDATGSYDLPFLIGGVLLGSGGVCHVALHLPCLRPPAEDHEIVMVEEIGSTNGGETEQPQVITMDDIKSGI